MRYPPIGWRERPRRDLTFPIGPVTIRPWDHLVGSGLVPANQGAIKAVGKTLKQERVCIPTSLTGHLSALIGIGIRPRRPVESAFEFSQMVPANLNLDIH